MRTLAKSLLLVVACSLVGCRSIGGTRSFTGPTCPAGWTILYTDYSAVAGGMPPVVCRRAAPGSAAADSGALREGAL